MIGEAVREPVIDTLELLHRGKVRDCYGIDDQRLLLVATDRLSAFDVVLPDAIPGKGIVLNTLSRFWFEKLAHLCPHHLLDEDPLTYLPPNARYLASRAMVVRRLAPLPVEAVVRGHLAGSAWQQYQTSGTVQGEILPAGLRFAQRLPQPLFTPTTKANPPHHDAPLSMKQLEQLLGAELAGRLQAASLALYQAAYDHALTQGFLLADTKLEFALCEDTLIWIDEAFTPDSSRFWDSEQWATMAEPPSFDKQLVRDYLLEIGWNQQPPGPHLPEAIIQETAARYRQVAERLGAFLPTSP
jgi:phosphoribosylaminoimidazole-succinocarboxamide synthase